jgi:3-oxoacyl-[acyl-carrier protein] reductase
MDVSNEAQVAEGFAQAHKRLGRPLNILVGNAGYVVYVDRTSSTPFETLWSHFETNTKGSILVMLSFLEHAVEKGATLINITSGAAVINFANDLSAYSASKVATMKMADYISREESHRDLRVFNLHPGVVPTSMAAEGKQNMQDTGSLINSRLII